MIAITVFCFQSNYSVIIFVESLDMLMQVDVHVNEDIQHKSTLVANVKTCSQLFQSVQDFVVMSAKVIEG